MADYFKYNILKGKDVIFSSYSGHSPDLNNSVLLSLIISNPFWIPADVKQIIDTAKPQEIKLKITKKGLSLAEVT